MDKEYVDYTGTSVELNVGDEVWVRGEVKSLDPYGFAIKMGGSISPLSLVTEEWKLGKRAVVKPKVGESYYSNTSSEPAVVDQATDEYVVYKWHGEYKIRRLVDFYKFYKERKVASVPWNGKVGDITSAPAKPIPAVGQVWVPTSAKAEYKIISVSGPVVTIRKRKSYRSELGICNQQISIGDLHKYYALSSHGSSNEDCA